MKKKDSVLSVFFFKLEREMEELKHFLLHLSHTYYITILCTYIIQPKTEY